MSARVRPALAGLALFVGASALSACSPANEAPVQSEILQTDSASTARGEDMVQPAADNCLLLVWQDQEERDERFDLDNDLADGGAISCATGTTASQFAGAFAAIRKAARSDDRAAILKEINLPLMYIDAQGHRRELTRADDVDIAFDEVFDEGVLTLLREVDLEDLTVVPKQGAFVELGSVWLVVNRNGGRPRIVTVNKQALGEAAEAVRAKASNPESAAPRG